MIALARAALKRLELAGADPDVVLGGRLLRAVSADVVESVAAGIRELAPNARIIVSPSEPIAGAALLGLDDLGADDQACARARAALDAAVAELAPGAAAVTADS